MSDLNNYRVAPCIDPADCYMGAGNANCWAGDIVAHAGRYWWFFSNHNKETGVMVADHPTGPREDALGGPLVDSFDPSIFTDDDGTMYIVYGHGDYFIAPLDTNMTSLAAAPTLIEIDRQGVFPVMDKNSLHKHNGIYYLSCSGYYATATNPLGPYTYRGLVGAGWGLDTDFAHGDFFTWCDQTYHVWCRYRNRDHDRMRGCFIAPTVYKADGRMHNRMDHLDRNALP